MDISSRPRVISNTRSARRPRRKPRLQFDRLEDRVALAASPAFSISDVILVEGNAGTIDATFTVSLSHARNRWLAVSYSTSDGPAVAGADYDATGGTLRFRRGQTSRTITVPVRGDTLDEVDESFFVNLSAPTRRATIAKGTGVATILDDDPPPAITIGDATIAESEGGAVAASFDVTLSAPSAQTITVVVSTADGTATAGRDYLALSRPITFAPGQTHQTIDIPIGRDLLDEDDETFTVNLSAPTNALIADAQGTGTIVDNDLEPSIIISDRGVSEAQGGTIPALFYVALSAPSGRVVTVDYSTADGTATAGSDYASTSGTLTFAPGQTSQTVAVPFVNDLLDEENETFFVNLSTPMNAVIADAQGFARIDDQDTAPYLSIDIPASTAEGDTESHDLTFTVSLSAPSGRTITVSYTTVNNGSTTAGTDFIATNGTLTFLPGTTTQTITVPILGDTLVEQHEIFFVQLSGPVNAPILSGHSRGVGTILNDDVETPPSSVSISNATVTEVSGGSTNANFTVMLLAPSSQVVTVAYTTADGSATAGADYSLTTGTLTFAPGQTSQTISVPILSDTADEPDESFFVQLETAINATIADGEGVGTIGDDDPTPNLSFSIEDASTVEGDSGARFLEFRVLLSGPSNSMEWAVFTTADGTATSDDYTPQLRDRGITFLPGVTEKTISIPILGDTSDEPDEVFYVNLIRASQTLSDNQAVGTILDDDTPEA